MKKITPGTWARLIALLISFTAVGSNLDLDNVTEFLTLGILVVSGITAWWKDNDVTKKARLRKQKLNEIESEER